MFSSREAVTPAEAEESARSAMVLVLERGASPAELAASAQLIPCRAPTFQADLRKAHLC